MGRAFTGVIDRGTMGVGDPACDLMVAWKRHAAEARDAIRDAEHWLGLGLSE